MESTLNPSAPRRRGTPKPTPEELATMPDWARQRRPWDISPGDWRYFLRGGIVILLLVALVTVIVRLILGRPLDEMVLLVSLLVTVVLVGTQWFGTVHVTRAISRLAGELPIAPRPLPPLVILAGTAVVFALALVGITGLLVYDDDRSLALGVVIAILPALVATGIIALLGRRTLAILKRPEVRQMLVVDQAVTDARRQHDDAIKESEPLDRP